MKRIALVAWATVALVAAGPATAATKLVASVGPGFTINLTKNGKRVTTLRTGMYRITVRDRSSFHTFFLKGVRITRNSGVAFVGTKTWTLRLRAGKYRYVCSPHASIMKGSFTVR